MIQIKPFEKAVELKSPRRVRKYILIWCASGEAVIAVDNGVFRLSPNSVLTITSGQIHYLKGNENALGFVLEFTYDFSAKTIMIWNSFIITVFFVILR